MPAEVTIAIRVRPGAGRTRVGGSHGEGGTLVVAVRERAVDGAATAAALKALAEAIGVRRGQVRLRHGATSRDKVVTVADPPADLGERLSRLREARG